MVYIWNSKQIEGVMKGVFLEPVRGNPISWNYIYFNCIWAKFDTVFQLAGLVKLSEAPAATDT